MEMCMNCKFIRKLHDSRFEGQCRRYPPKLIEMFIKNDDFYGRFPIVNDISWCGEWEKDPDK